MITIVYKLPGNLESDNVEDIKKELDKFYVLGVVASYNITDNVLILILEFDDPSIIFNLGSVIGISIAASLSKSKYVSK
jgi:hypothetical protein